MTKNDVVAIAITIQMTDLIDRDHDPAVDRDRTREDIQDHIREIEILKKEEDTDPKPLIQDRDPERENDRHVIVTINRIVIDEVIPEVEREVQCVGVVHLEEVVLIVPEEVHQEKCQDEVEVVVSNKIVGGGQTIEIIKEVQKILPVVEDVANLNHRINIKIVLVRSVGIISNQKIAIKKTGVVKTQIVIAKMKNVIAKTKIAIVKTRIVSAKTRIVIAKIKIMIVNMHIVIVKTKIGKTGIVLTEIMKIESAKIVKTETAEIAIATAVITTEVQVQDQ